MATKTALGPETVERLIEEVEEWSGRVHKIRQKMTRTKREGEPYLIYCPSSTRSSFG